MSSLRVVARKGSPFWYLRGTVRGVTVNETTRTTDGEAAEQIRIKRENQILAETIHGARASVTFADAAIAYVGTARPTGTQRDAVIGRLRQDGTLTRNLADIFAGKLVSKIDQAEVDRAARRHFGHAKPATVQRQFLTPLVAVLRFAAKRKWCDVPAFDRPKQRHVRKRWATYEEADALLAAATPRIAPLLAFLMFTGARLGEALALDWADVDLQARWAVFWDTKREAPRGVPLHRQVVVALANLPEREGRVFRTIRGRPYAEKKVQGGGQIKTAWAATCRRAGIAPGLTPHSLRHTCATWLAMAGVDDATRDQVIGHADPRMGRHYVHIPDRVMIEAVDKLPDRALPAQQRVHRSARRKKIKTL